MNLVMKKEEVKGKDFDGLIYVEYKNSKKQAERPFLMEYNLIFAQFNCIKLITAKHLFRTLGVPDNAFEKGFNSSICTLHTIQSGSP